MKSERILLKGLGIFILASLPSCSLQYEKVTDTKASVPEIVFTNVKFSRYERNNQKLNLTSSKLEEYKSDGAYFAEEAEFCTWDSKGKLDTVGSCGLIGILPNENTYTLLKGVQIENNSQGIKISAETMQWNDKTEQLIFAKDDLVHFVHGDLELTGKGFSASGVSGRFEFEGPVEGAISTDDIEEAE
ncbi:MAG: LPS export ABC transporter periplasmic protein LptC [Treponema sp.]|nr:LPS export ABC transporter periplasmic protein LptC [Treponema sp.]